MNILILCSHPYSLINFRGKLIKELIYKKNKVFVMAPNINANLYLNKQLKELGVEAINYPINNRSLNDKFNIHFNFFYFNFRNRRGV